MAVVAFIEPPQRDVIEKILRGHQSVADHRFASVPCGAHRQPDRLRLMEAAKAWRAPVVRTASRINWPTWTWTRSWRPSEDHRRTSSQGQCARAVIVTRLILQILLVTLRLLGNQNSYQMT